MKLKKKCKHFPSTRNISMNIKNDCINPPNLQTQLNFIWLAILWHDFSINLGSYCLLIGQYTAYTPQGYTPQITRLEDLEKYKVSL